MSVLFRKLFAAMISGDTHRFDKIPGQVVADTQITTADSQLEDQMADYYSAEFAQMDYYNY